MKLRRPPLVYVFAATAILIGCSGENLPIVPVSGKVTYNGGTWPADGMITFSPTAVADGHPRRPAVGKFGPDGTFEVMSFRPGDGLIPGTYSVGISCFEKQPDSNNPITFEKYNLVPKDFRPQDVIVDPSARSATVEFDVPKKK